jgi:hypothetical protein
MSSLQRFVVKAARRLMGGNEQEAELAIMRVHGTTTRNFEPVLPSSHAQAPDAYILAWGVEVAAAPAPAPMKVAL